jgi:hypothetical protein
MPARRTAAPVLDLALGAPSRVRLLRVFFAGEGPYTGRGAARAAGLAHRPSVRALGQLVALGLLHVTRGVPAHRYRVNAKHPLAKRLRRLFEREADA